MRSYLEKRGIKQPHPQGHWYCLTYGHYWRFFGYHRIYGGNTYICKRCGYCRSGTDRG